MGRRIPKHLNLASSDLDLVHDRDRIIAIVMTLHDEPYLEDRD